ncbi:hypothetical protein AsAng_0011310 [Aureispira anguillae]|uniref:Uncharacterized protein n=1 Tax=Aureispira anguillae TaxID=2864201 RepID=A0A915YCB5_9BACT|nr:hypothetical protein AsAng_0011310 [Aureispira anguillae]
MELSLSSLNWGVLKQIQDQALVQLDCWAIIVDYCHLIFLPKDQVVS